MIIGPRSTNAGEELPLTAEQREHANTLDFESLKAYLTELQIAHLGLVQDPLHADVYHMPEPKTAQPKRFAIGITDPATGKKEFLEADSQEALNALQLQWYRDHQSTPAQEQPRGADGKFKAAEKTADPDAAAQERAILLADLETKFRTGSITPSEYIIASGALADAVEKAVGAPLEVLADLVQKQQGQKITEGWTGAVTAFIQNHPSWEGGDFNRDVLKNIISENGWDDAEDKLSALEAAYEYASANNLLQNNPANDAYRAISSASSREEMNEALQKYRSSGGVWDSR